ncbi:hypothetical protein TcasGA2_TC000293 [Tribolium castaneum]|uniref:Protein TsetseEP domain-containing protein n=1 Tax=Tribolium castaneum TaxID=7070 RepID=D6WBB7_TRICA|nr:PREDICTED: uncharacterized protein LOC107399243 [Tribolium castaneum]EEZ97908.1 hypothetical protein TcasGA2_TC000293 [Tribolium castaneum]|eukprot:XP_015840715.1 PREDICTED: uncharacterized protein LOC107399243 [Tribolium castaneum]
MPGQLFFLLLSLSAVQVRCSLIDDATAKLETLRQTVLSSITLAENHLNDLSYDFGVYAVNVKTKGILSIQTGEDEVTSELDALKALGESAGVDVSYCFGAREEYLTNLPGVVIEELEQCILGNAQEASKISSSIQYIVDIKINKVDALQFQLELCDPDSEACIKPIVQEIELETINIPNSISTQIVRANGLFDELEVSVQSCSDLKVSQYTSSTSVVLKDITQCVNSIIG